MDKDRIAQHLQMFIKLRGMTQEEFARHISAPLSSVSSWVLGKRSMSKAWQALLREKKILPDASDENL